MRRAKGKQQPRSHAERLASTDGYFAPGSVLRRVGNSPITPFLGGGTAVLLQVAHPLVAVGVADHSDFRRDLWRRLLRTLRALYLIAYGSRAEAEQAGAIVQAVHSRVRGLTQARLGPFPPGTAYSADDPELMLWVHATLVEASLSAYERFEHPLSAGEQEQFYREMVVVAELFGTPRAVIPGTLTDYRDYFAAQLESPSITVTPIAKQIADVIMRAPLPPPMRLFAPAHRLATKAQLPERLRREYELSWTPLQAVLVEPAAASVKYMSWPILETAKRLRPRAHIVTA